MFTRCMFAAAFRLSQEVLDEHVFPVDIHPTATWGSLRENVMLTDAGQVNLCTLTITDSDINNT